MSQQSSRSVSHPTLNRPSSPLLRPPAPLLPLSLLLSLLLLFSLAACGGRASQQEDTADLTIDLTAGVQEVGPTTLIVEIADGEGQPVNDAVVDVTGDMSHAGMVPVVRENIEAEEDGVYVVPFEWTMGGDWIVTVVATLPDGRKATRAFDLTVEGGMSGMGDG